MCGSPLRGARNPPAPLPRVFPGSRSFLSLNDNADCGHYLPLAGLLPGLPEPCTLGNRASAFSAFRAFGLGFPGHGLCRAAPFRSEAGSGG
jgi:hypothetical protein